MTMTAVECSGMVEWNSGHINFLMDGGKASFLKAQFVSEYLLRFFHCTAHKDSSSSSGVDLGGGRGGGGKLDVHSLEGKLYCYGRTWGRGGELPLYPPPPPWINF